MNITVGARPERGDGGCLGAEGIEEWRKACFADGVACLT